MEEAWKSGRQVCRLLLAMDRWKDEWFRGGSSLGRGLEVKRVSSLKDDSQVAIMRSVLNSNCLLHKNSRVRKPRRSHAELMKLPWRRMKVRKLEDERRSGAEMVFGEALKWGWANTQARGLEETKKENSSLSWFTKREESGVISTKFLYYIHEWKYKGLKLSIYSRKGEPNGPEKGTKKGSRMWYLEPKREHETSVTWHLSKSQGTCF